MVIPTRLILTAGIHTLGVGAAGHALHHLTVAVVAGDVDARLLQLLLDVHVGHKDHATHGDEVAAHLVHVRDRLRAQTEGCD